MFLKIATDRTAATPRSRYFHRIFDRELILAAVVALISSAI